MSLGKRERAKEAIAFIGTREEKVKKFNIAKSVVSEAIQQTLLQKATDDVLKVTSFLRQKPEEILQHKMYQAMVKLNFQDLLIDFWQQNKAAD